MPMVALSYVGYGSDVSLPDVEGVLGSDDTVLIVDDERELEPDPDPDPEPDPDVDGVVDPEALGPPLRDRLTPAPPEPRAEPAAPVVPRPEVTFFGALAAGLRPLRAERRTVGRPLRMACSYAISWRR